MGHPGFMGMGHPMAADGAQVGLHHQQAADPGYHHEYPVTQIEYEPVTHKKPIYKVFKVNIYN